jgi:hypothetical protein
MAALIQGNRETTRFESLGRLEAYSGSSGKGQTYPQGPATKANEALQQIHALWVGNRQTIRRWSDRKTHLYVDRYGHGLLIILLVLMSLSVLDAYSTIFLVERGGQEINPLMKVLMEYGYMCFFVVKYVLTALAVFILCICKNHFLMRLGTVSILFLYSMVLINNLFGLFHLRLL